MKVDLNDLGRAAYNELIRLKFIDNIEKNQLNENDLSLINYKIYNKMGDNLLSQIVDYNDELDPNELKFDFDRTIAYTQLILNLALCYANGMNLNDYFNLKVKI